MSSKKHFSTFLCCVENYAWLSYLLWSSQNNKRSEKVHKFYWYQRKNLLTRVVFTFAKSKQIINHNFRLQGCFFLIFFQKKKEHPSARWGCSFFFLNQDVLDFNLFFLNWGNCLFLDLKENCFVWNKMN